MRPAIYCRVSTTEQTDGYSLSQQERACRDYCRAHDWDEPTVYVDAGRSAYTDKTEARPQFAAMLAAAVSGDYDVIVVHKLDRFARSLTVTLRELQRLEAAKVGFVSISESMDFTTPIGRVILSVLGAFAEYYSRNLSTEVRKGQAGRRLAGHPQQQRPYGAAVRGTSWVPDPRRSAHLARILALCATESFYNAAQILNAERVPTMRGGPWQANSVRMLLKHSAWLLSQPEPWPTRYAAALARDRRPTVRSDRTVRLLSGLLRCGVCGGRMAYGSPTRTTGHILQCDRTPEGPNACLPGAPRKTGSLHYEAQVLAWVTSLPPQAGIRAAAERLQGGDDPALAQLAAIREDRERLRDAYRARLYSFEEFEREVAMLDAREAAIPAPARRSARRVDELIAAIRDFPTLPPDVQNTVLRGFLAERVVITGREIEVIPSPYLSAILCEIERTAVAA